MNFIRASQPGTVIALLLAAWSLALGAGTYWLAWGLTLFFLAQLHWGFRLGGPPRVLIVVLMAIPFVLWMRLLDKHTLTGFSQVDWLFMIGFYGVAIGGYVHLSAVTPAEHHEALASALFAFALSGAAPDNRWFVPGMVLFIPVLLWQTRRELDIREKPGRRYLPGGRHIAALAVLLALSLGVHAGWVRLRPGFNQWLENNFFNSRGNYGQAGFSGDRATLGAVQTIRLGPQSNKVMLRLWSAQPLEYLRGAVYQTYQAGSSGGFGSWNNMEAKNPVTTEGDAPADRVFYSLSGVGAEQAAPQAWIYPDDSLAQTFFLPLQGQLFAAYGGRLRGSAAWTVESRARLSAGGYVVYDPGSAAQAMPAPDENDLDVPAALRPALTALSGAITSPRDPPAERARKLQTWFDENFHYELGMVRHTQKDPVLEFLQDQRTGHCEYFASAATLLLRTLKVPCRYVSGFVVREQVRPGLWVARGQDAHAWVEMYVSPAPGQPQQWVTFDPTVAGGQPHPLPTTASERWFEGWASLWARFYGMLSYGGVLAVLSVAWETLTGWVVRAPLWVWGVILLPALLWVFRAEVRRLLRRRQREALSPQVKAWRAQLRQAERLARPYGAVRDPAATVASYLAQVRQCTMPDAVRTRIEALLDNYQSQRFRPPGA